MNPQHLLRQSDIVEADKLTRPISIVGAGAIGSFTALLLAKMGYQGELHVCDPDTIESHNLSNQFYPLRAVRQPKVNALAQVLKDYAGIEIDRDYRRLNHCPSNADLVVFAVDSMDTRIRFWNTTNRKFHQWIFDARMGAELMRIYTVNLALKTDRALYEKTLYNSKHAEQLPCTARTVIYNVAVVAGLLVNQIKRTLMGQTYKREIIFDLKTTTLLTQ